MQITFERTKDYNLLTKLLRNEKLYDFISDDFSPPLQALAVPESDIVWYVLCWHDEELLGFFLFFPYNTVCWEYHTVMLLDGRAKEATQALFVWVWENTNCRRIITSVLESNRVALRFGLRVGLKEFGRNEKSFMKNGQLQTQILLGISCPTKEK